MALPFALRARIQWRDEPRPARRFRAPKLAGPVLAYWSAMAALAYGVSTHALPLDDWFWPPPPVTEADDDVRDVLPPPPPPRVNPFPAKPGRTAPPTASAPAAPLIAANEPEPVDVPEPARSSSPSGAPLATRLHLSAPGAALPSDDSDEDRDVAETDRDVAETDRAGSQTAVTRALAPATANATTAERTGARVASRAADERERPTTWHGSEWAEPTSPFAPGPRGKNVRGLALTTGSARRDLRDDSGKWLYLDDESAPSARTSVSARSIAPAARRDDAAPTATSSPSATQTPTNVGSCEAAIAGANEVIDMTASRGAPDVTRDAYASLLDNGRYLSSCRIPAGVGFEICAAIKNGRAVGVTVTTKPRDASVSACVRRAVTRLSFPTNPRLDVTRTRFDALR